MMKKRERTLKGFLAFTAVMLFSLLILTLTPTNAQAISGFAGGGGGSGGSTGGGWGAITRWNYVDTWSELENARYMQSNMNSQGAGASNAREAAEWYVRTSTGGQAMLDQCQSSNLLRIYYLGASGGIPIKPNSSTGIFPWSNPAGGDSLDAFASGYNGRGIYVICVVNNTERKSYIEYDTRNQSTSTTINGVYSLNSQVTPEPIQVNAGTPNTTGEDLIGVDNLNPQSASEKTNFGDVYDSIASSGSGNYNTKVNQINAANAADATAVHADITLNSANTAGLAEGGVLSVNEFRRNASITLNQGWGETRQRTITCDYQAGTWNLANPSNCTTGSWSAWTEDSGSRTHTVTKNMGTQQNMSFWQILAVHCNPDELSAALSAYGTAGTNYNVVSQTVTDTGVTSVIHTTAVTSRPTAASARIFGVASNSNAALARTGVLGFYDKECTIQCTTSSAASSGATTTNGARSNVSNTGNLASKDSLGGAISSGVNSNYLEMFRDNQQREITTNIAYPNVSGTAFSYNGHAPISTTVTLWHDPSQAANSTLSIGEGNAGYPATGSTPDTSAAGGQLFVYGSGKTGSGTISRAQLFTGTTAPATQKNFSLADASHPLDTYSGAYATQVAGAYNRFDISATWASMADRPVVLNTKWEYQPTTNTTVPNRVSFNSAGQGVVLGTTSVNQKIDVRCYGVYGTDTSVMGSAYNPQTQTGTGTTNTVDTNVLNRTVLNGSADSSAYLTNTNLVIKFIRGVAE